MTDLEYAIERLTAWIRNYGDTKEKAFVGDVSLVLLAAKDSITLQAENKTFRQFVADTADGFDCLPGCNSWAHEELCPVANTIPAWRQMQEENDRLREQIEKMQTGQDIGP